MRNDEWTLITIESYTSITAELGRIRAQLLWANVLAALAFIVVAAIIARSITWPIHALAQNMRNVEVEIALGDRSRVVRTDEIGMLQRTYELMRRKIRRLMREIGEKEKKKREAELEALQLQISPHFLFNTLSSVRWAILNKNNGKAAKMIFALGNLLRMSLLKTNALITVEQEVQNLAHYIDIIKLRSGASFAVRYTIDTNVTQDLVPRLLLQPIVENAVIHGMDGARTGGVIEVGATRKARNLVFTVTDNGKGMRAPARGSASKTAKLSGIGMRNVDERIKLIYGDHFGLRSESYPGNGTTVTIMIPAMPRMKPV
jgi:two-component system sensor histidine kinase YesM